MFATDFPPVNDASTINHLRLGGARNRRCALLLRLLRIPVDFQCARYGRRLFDKKLFAAARTRLHPYQDDQVIVASPGSAFVAVGQIGSGRKPPTRIVAAINTMIAKKGEISRPPIG